MSATLIICGAGRVINGCDDNASLRGTARIDFTAFFELDIPIQVFISGCDVFASARRRFLSGYCHKQC